MFVAQRSRTWLIADYSACLRTKVPEIGYQDIKIPGNDGNNERWWRDAERWRPRCSDSKGEWTTEMASTGYPSNEGFPRIPTKYYMTSNLGDRLSREFKLPRDLMFVDLS